MSSWLAVALADEGRSTSVIRRYGAVQFSCVHDRRLEVVRTSISALVLGCTNPFRPLNIFVKVYFSFYGLNATVRCAHWSTCEHHRGAATTVNVYANSPIELKACF